MKAIILSIKPQFSTQIYTGNKTVELRKSIGKSVTTGTRIYIYSSSPIQAIDGIATIARIEYFNVEQSKNAMTKAGCISVEAYTDYYKNKGIGVGLWLKDIVQFTQPVPLKILKKASFTPPQAFTYGNDAVWALIEKHSKT